MAGGFHNSDDDPIAEINIVPLVDIILVVLIIFMVTAPMIMKPSINVKLPKAVSGESTKASKLHITVGINNVLFLNGKKITLNKIGSFSRKQVSKNPDVQAIIAADEKVPHGRVVQVLDKVKASGVRKFAISIDRK